MSSSTSTRLDSSQTEIRIPAVIVVSSCMIVVWRAFYIINFIAMMYGFHMMRPNCISKVGGNLRLARNRLRRQISKEVTVSTINNNTPSYYITTPIYYVNGNPHLGHAYTSTIADVLARYHRMFGNDVHFLTGTDEHGQKVEQSAVKSGESTECFSSKVSDNFRSMTNKLGCSNDDFIRTTEERHKRGVHHLWQKLEASGQIYLGSYEGWYSVRDEAFYTEMELVNGKAPTGADVEWVREESYFFRLSQWTDRLREFYESNPDFIAPKSKRNEVLAFINQEGGLRDLSISRTTFSWGIPVPGNPKHVVYVWLDALANYITALGYPDMDSERFRRHWPASVHIVGKDILRFHAIFWPAFLMAAGIPTPKKVFAHGWWTRDGEKMSKSVGNVLDPFELIDKYGVDYVRYFMASEFHFGNDGNFCHDAFCNRINVDLANDLGNLAQRAMTLVERHSGGIVPAPGAFTVEDEEVLTALRNNAAAVEKHLHQLGVKHACDEILSLAKLGNKYIVVQAPWELAKTNPERCRTVLYVLMEVLRHSAIMLQPVMPQACDAMLTLLGVPREFEYRNMKALSAYSVVGNKISTPQPIFPKLLFTPPVQSPTDCAAANGTAQIEKINLCKYDNYDLDQATTRLAEVAEEIRQRKAQKVNKKELEPQVHELLFLKARINKLKGCEGK